jgi:hypothetical protein
MTNTIAFDVDDFPLNRELPLIKLLNRPALSVVRWQIGA